MERPTSLFGFSEGGGFWRSILPYALLLSVTFGLYARSLYYQFVWDDVVYIAQNYRIQGLSWPRMRAVWTGTYLGHYAPVHHTFLAILHSFSGMEPFGYHAGQLLLHAACVVLLYFLLRKIESPRVALAAMLLWVVHPVNIETVAWISETKSTLALLFFLLSFWAFLRWRERERWLDLSVCILCLILSVLSKINTVVAPAIYLLFEYWQGFPFRRKRIAALAGLFLTSAIFVAVHLFSFHGSETTLESAYYGGLGVHILNLPFLVLFYLRMLVYPHPLSAWHMFRIYDHFTWIVAAAWIGLLALVWILYRSNREIQFWGFWFLIFLAPVLQIIPFPIWVAERYLYIPAIGIFVLAGRLFFTVLDRLSQPWQRFGWELGMCALLVCLAWVTTAHLPIWKDDLTLWEATADTCQTSAYCHTNLGMALLQNGQYERGVKELIRAVEIRPAPLYLTRLGDAYTLVRDYRQALIAYNMAIESERRYLGADFYAKLARAYLLTGQTGQAQLAIEMGTKANPNDPTLLVIEGILRWKQGKFDEARTALRKALIITGQTSNPSGFISRYWDDPAEVGKLIADLRSPAREVQPVHGDNGK